MTHENGSFYLSRCIFKFWQVHFWLLILSNKGQFIRFRNLEMAHGGKIWDTPYQEVTNFDAGLRVVDHLLNKSDI